MAMAMEEERRVNSQGDTSSFCFCIILFTLCPSFVIKYGMEFFNKVYEIVKLIPQGKVATYGDIARALGNPRMARQVGWALHANPTPIIVPCHRVVNRFGFLSGGFAFGGIKIQKERLENEGVEVDNDYHVDLNKYRHKF